MNSDDSVQPIQSNPSVSREEPTNVREDGKIGKTEDEIVTFGQSFWPPTGTVSKVLKMMLAYFMLWCVLWGLFGREALPGGHFFGLFGLVLLSYIGGQLIILVKLPPLLGMLITGFILRNVTFVNIAKDIKVEWTSSLRSIALVIILLRGGLGLDPSALRELSGACLRLTFIPCLVECTIVAVASHLLLGFPWMWGFLLGFVLAAVSPAVVVPSMLALQNQKLGVDKGIPTLIMAAAGFDDVAAITGFGVVTGIVFSKGNIIWTIFKGPLEAILGLLYGGVVGAIFWYLPSKDDLNVAGIRPLFLTLGGLLVMFVSIRCELGGTGALGCISVAFVAAFRWKKEKYLDSSDLTLNIAWQLFQPVLFGLIGSEVKLSSLQWESVGLGLAVLIIALIIRMITSFLVVYGANFTYKERLFITLAWIPKATVQAAIGPVALDFARETKASDHIIQLATQVLTIGVLAIIVTAPLGAGAIALSAPKLLKQSQPDLETQQELTPIKLDSI